MGLILSLLTPFLRVANFSASAYSFSVKPKSFPLEDSGVDFVFVDTFFAGGKLFGFCVFFFGELVFTGKEVFLVLAFPRGFDIRHSELDGELLGGFVGKSGFCADQVRSLQKYDHNFFMATFHWAFSLF